MNRTIYTTSAKKRVVCCIYDCLHICYFCYVTFYRLNQIHCLIFLLYLIIYSIHFLECIKVCLVLNQHNLFYLTCMNVLKACNLLAITYARLDYWFLIFFIIRLCNCLFLK